MDYHLLNGQCLGDIWPKEIPGLTVVMNEAFLEGPLGYDTSLEDLWPLRASFWEVSMEQYHLKTLMPLEMLLQAGGTDRILGWFGTDLFCQVNWWFLTAYLHSYRVEAQLGVIFPPSAIAEETWGHFPKSSLKVPIPLPFFPEATEIALTLEIWDGYCRGNLDQLDRLAEKYALDYPVLTEAVRWYIRCFPKDGDGYLFEKVLELIDRGLVQFPELLHIFSTECPQLGLTDRQIAPVFAHCIRQKK